MTLPPRFLTGAAAAAGIGLINSLGNLGGFAAPYVTGALADATGNNRAAMWAVGAILVLCAGLVVVLRAAPGGLRSARSAGDANFRRER